MNKELFISGLNELNIEPTEEQICKFSKYSDLLKEWNENINLTTITDDDGIAIKHFLDCVLPLSYIDLEDSANIADIGTGAGFPGLPIKIMREDISLTLVDSLNKRVKFLSTVSESLNLRDVECIHARAEELSRNQKYREKFDYVFSRAVANLTTLSEYCLPYVTIGGYFVALKSNDVEHEISESKSMIGTLGGVIEDVVKAPLPKSDIIRSLIIIKKVKITPKSFPRNAKKIKQQNNQTK